MAPQAVDVETKTTEGEALHRLVGDLNQAQFCKEHGIPGGPSLLSQHCSGNRAISLDSAIAYARGLRKPIRAFSPRLQDELERIAKDEVELRLLVASTAATEDLVAAPTPSDSAPSPIESSGSVIAAVGRKIAAAAPSLIRAFEEEFVAVRRADVRFANGVGQVYYEADDKPPLVFRMDFLRKLGIKSGKAVVVDSRGISNEPKIRDRSVVLVNSGDKEHLDNDFFAFRYDGELLIKRLERVEGVGILATAENSDFKPKSKLYKNEDLANFEIIGRAVWEGAEL